MNIYPCWTWYFFKHIETGHSTNFIIFNFNFINFSDACAPVLCTDTHFMHRDMFFFFLLNRFYHIGCWFTCIFICMQLLLHIRVLYSLFASKMCIAISAGSAIRGLFGCWQVMLQVVSYITAIKIATTDVAVTCITVFGLGVTSGK